MDFLDFSRRHSSHWAELIPYAYDESMTISLQKGDKMFAVRRSTAFAVFDTGALTSTFLAGAFATGFTAFAGAVDFFGAADSIVTEIARLQGDRKSSIAEHPHPDWCC